MSCQKGMDTQLRPQSDDTVFLSKFVRLDTGYLPGMDTVYIADFQYDAQKRISRINEIYGGTGTAQYSSVTTIQYAGNDTLPYRFFSEMTRLGYPPYYNTDTIYLYYNNGQVTRDSSIKYRQNAPWVMFRKTYREITPGFYEVKRDFFDFNTGGIIVTETIRCKRAKAGNNITFLSDSIITSNNDCYERHQIVANYDNMKNPFWRFRLPFPVNPYSETIKYVYGTNTESVLEEGDNNVVYFDHSGANQYVPAFHSFIGYSILYNSYGYPSVRRISSATYSYKYKDFFSYIIL